MRGIEGLIRLSKWKLDEKRRAVVDLELLRAGLDRQIRQLDTELDRERKVAAASLEANFGFTGYHGANRQKRARLVASLDEVQVKIALAQEEVNDAFRELKKFELVKENRLAAAAREQARREQAELDEAGLQGFLRGGQGNQGGGS